MQNTCCVFLFRMQQYMLELLRIKVNFGKLGCNSWNSWIRPILCLFLHSQLFPVAVSSFDWFDEHIYAIPGFGSCLNFLSDTISYQKVRPAHNQGPSAIIHVKHWRPSRVCRKSCNCGRKQSFEHPFRSRYKKARRTLSWGNLPTPN